MERGALMKPVIKKQTYYSVVLMRDDGNVRSFRIKNTALRVLVILCLFFFVAGGTGLWAGIHYWKRYNEFLPEYKERERILAESYQELAYLRNLKAVVTAQNPNGFPLTMNNELGVDAPSGVASTMPLTNQNGTLTQSANATLAGSAEVTVAVGESIPPATEATPEHPATQEAQAHLPRTTDAGSPVRINGFTAQPSGQQSLRVRYTLSVAQYMESGQDSDTVSGLARYVAIFNDGTRVDLDPQVQGNSRFSISRMKQMSIIARLPQGYTTEDVKDLDIFIELVDGPTFQDTYSFPQ
jgi:hypothetical protein